ncbi:hypothetical protein GBAR_LOCUS8669 [Geodia barretti]|uniref:Uncharacterized protein n=1 Tax=Geodia barretti TaxID=519541 RepID=A0AA35RLJ2_GEOBA|nr:hypothetical protein GBAR_LOCUS8669 [Geodia barretti]
MTQSTLSSTAALLQYPVTPTSVKLLYMLKQLLLYSPSTQSLTLTVSANSFTIAQSISDGGNGEDTYFMPTSSSIANTNDDNFEIVTSTATTITPKSTIAKDMEQCTKTITLTTTLTSTPVSEICACKNVDKEPCTESTAVIAGGVGGGIILCQILVCLPIAIFCICNRYCVFVERNMVCCVRLDFVYRTSQLGNDIPHAFAIFTDQHTVRRWRPTVTQPMEWYQQEEGRNQNMK